MPTVQTSSSAPWGWIALGVAFGAFLFLALFRQWSKPKVTSQVVQASLASSPASPLPPPAPPVEHMTMPIAEAREEAKKEIENLQEQQKKSSEEILDNPEKLNEFLKDVGRQMR